MNKYRNILRLKYMTEKSELSAEWVDSAKLVVPQFTEYMCEGTLNYWPSSANDFLTWPLGRQLWHLSHLSLYVPSVSKMGVIYLHFRSSKKEKWQSFPAVFRIQRGNEYRGFFCLPVTNFRERFVYETEGWKWSLVLPLWRFWDELYFCVSWTICSI